MVRELWLSARLREVTGGCVAKEQAILDLAGNRGGADFGGRWAMPTRLVKGTQIDPNRLAKVRAATSRAPWWPRARSSPSPRSRSSPRHRASWRSSLWTSTTTSKGPATGAARPGGDSGRGGAQRAQLAAAEANVSTYVANIEQDKVNAAAPDLPMYKATLDRNLEMQKEGIVSRQALDDANKDYLAALTRRDSAKAQIGVDTARLKQARAQVHAEPGQPQATGGAAQLHHHRGSHGRRNSVARCGDRRCGQLHPRTGLHRHAGHDRGRYNQVYVQGKVDEADIAHVYMGQPARIKVESFRDRTFVGKVTKIAPLGVEKDNVTTFEVRVSIDNPGGELKANMTANAEIILDEHKNVLQVPENAVNYDNLKNAFVEVPDKSQKEGTRKVPVTVGLSNGSANRNRQRPEGRRPGRLAAVAKAGTP